MIYVPIAITVVSNYSNGKITGFNKSCPWIEAASQVHVKK